MGMEPPSTEHEPVPEDLTRETKTEFFESVWLKEIRLLIPPLRKETCTFLIPPQK